MEKEAEDDLHEEGHPCSDDLEFVAVPDYCLTGEAEGGGEEDEHACDDDVCWGQFHFCVFNF